MIDFRNDIYNEEIKIRFLEDINIDKYPPRWWERVFENSFEFENKKQKDLYAFTTPEILEFYKFIEAKTLTSLVITNTNVIKYGDWALQNNLIFDGQNHFCEISMEMLNQCVSKVSTLTPLTTFKGFMDFLRGIKNDQDKYIFMAMFEGIKGKQYEEIVKLQLSDIDEPTKTVKLCTGRKMSVSPEFIQICKNADSQTDYLALSDDIEKEDLIERPLTPSIYIYKEKANSRGINTPRTVFNTVVRNIAYMGYDNKSLTVKMIRDYGLICHLNNRAAKYKMHTVDMLYGDKSLYEDIVNKYYFNLNTKKRFILEYEEYFQ